MYEILAGKRTVNGIPITTWKREITNANILEVEVGSTGFQGGDTGHGGRTYFRIMDGGSTDIRVTPLRDKYDCCGVEITLGGDTELETFIEALEFAVKVLKKEAAKEAPPAAR